MLFPCWLCHGFWTFSWSNGNFNVNYIFVPPPVQGRCDVPTIFWIHCPYSNLIIFQATKIELVVGVCFPVVAWCWVGTNRDVLFHHQCCVYSHFDARPWFLHIVWKNPKIGGTTGNLVRSSWRKTKSWRLSEKRRIQNIMYSRLCLKRSYSMSVSMVPGFLENFFDSSLGPLVCQGWVS